MFFVRQGATHKVPIGPAVAVGDGFTPTAALDLSTADTAYAILHDNATAIDISGYTMAAVANATGQYLLTLQAAISGTVGQMRITITDDSLMLPLIADFTILDTAAYDAKYKDGAEGPLQATTVGRKLDVSAAGAAGIDWANVEGKTATVGLTGTTVGITTLNSDMVAEAPTDVATGTKQDTMETTLGAITAAGPTKTQMDTAHDALATETKQDAQDLIITEARLAELDSANLPSDVDDIKTQTDKLGTAMPDSVPADGVIADPIQALYMLVQIATEMSITGTTMTIKKVNGTTTLIEITLNDDTTPTSKTRSA